LCTLFLAQFFIVFPLAAQSPVAGDSRESKLITAPVELDGETLFHVRGLLAQAAEERAAEIADSIHDFAADSSLAPESIRVEDEGSQSRLVAGNRNVMVVSDADAAVEGLSRADFATALAQRISKAAQTYREERRPKELFRDLAFALLATIVVFGGLKMAMPYVRRLELRLHVHAQDHLQRPRMEALGILNTARLLSGLEAAFKVLRTVAVVVVAFLYLQTLLALFPWTRPISHGFLKLFMNPLANMGSSILQAIPDLVFLLVLFVVVRYGLRLLGVVFEGVQNQTIRIGELDPELAVPTYRIVRLGVLAFALVIAYPYLPGSGSEAFKGVTLFLGVLFSLGSTSAIANSIAGFALTYRRAYKVGDMVRIDNTVGHVERMRAQVTHLRSEKNEEVIIPNSVILNTTVINYSSLAKDRGLIVHASITVDYNTLWRRVETLLLEAAHRTPGILAQPSPFVLQSAFTDFGAVYELNAYCDQPNQLIALETALRRHILDVLDENGVRWPEYERDVRPMSLPATAR
jgi:small-conductance mechanosensitive channel